MFSSVGRAPDLIVGVYSISFIGVFISVGSSPTTQVACASLAHQVEHFTSNEEVASSSLAGSSKV